MFFSSGFDISYLRGALWPGGSRYLPPGLGLASPVLILVLHLQSLLGLKALGLALARKL